MNKNEIKELIKKWSQTIGAYPRKVRIIKMKHKWASVSSRGTLTLNAFLLDLPPSIIEYVIVHELIHLKTKIKTHNKLFKATISSYLPDWESRDKKLREIGNSMEL
jgi:hypothetical protein